MPDPRPGESKNDFISRCMSSAEARRTAPEQDHRVALCNGLWEQAKKAEADPRDAPIAQIKKTDSVLQIAYAEVYVPDVPDSHGDFMTRDEIRKMAHLFMREGLTSAVDVEHDQNADRGCAVVESFIARDGDPDFIPGSWVAGVHIPDLELWQQVEKGDLNGFSIEGLASSTKKSIFLDMPATLNGATDEAQGHYHAFTVRFDDEGNFVGGMTVSTFPEGHPDHSHRIDRGTVTEPGGANAHTHRFSFVEDLANAQARG